MRSRNLVVLVVFVAALAAFILFFERHQPSTDERSQRADRIFPELDEDEVVALDLRTGHGPIRLAKVSDEWRLIEPVDYPADGTAVRTLVRSLATLDADRVLPLDEVRAGDYGLEDPVLGVVVEEGDGTRHSLEVGDETPLGSRRAVRRDGEDGIVLCSGTFVANLDREVDEWRSRDVVNVLEDDLAVVTIESGTDEIRVVRSGERWQLEQPVGDLADAEQMRSLVSELNALRISEFIGGEIESAAVGLEPPEYRIEVIGVDDDPVVLELAAPTEGESTVICRRNGSELFRIPDGIRARLGKAPVRWRSAKVWPFSSWDAARMEIAGDGGEVLLDRVDGIWQLGGDGEVDDAEVRRRLTALADLEAREHDLMVPPTRVMGSVILVLEDDGAAEGLTYTFYSPLETGGLAAVTVSSRRDVMGVDAAVVETIVGDLERLRPAAAEPATGDQASEQAE